jgi:hypothetical protein
MPCSACKGESRGFTRLEAGGITKMKLSAALRHQHDKDNHKSKEISSLGGFWK